MNQLPNLNTVIEKTIRYDASINPDLRSINLAVNGVETNASVKYVNIQLDSPDPDFGKEVSINFQDRGNNYNYKINGLDRFTYGSVSAQSVPALAIPANLKSNLLVWSEEFDNAVWTKSASSISSNATTAPDGTLTADKIIEDTSGGPHEIIQRNTLIAGQTYVVSLFAKAAERTRIRITLDGIAFGGTPYLANFDLSTGATLFVSSGLQAAIQSVGDWYRISVVSPVVTTSVFNSLAKFSLVSGATTGYTGDGTSGLFIWGAQVEYGSVLNNYTKTESAKYFYPYNPFRTNFYLQSQNFASSSWNKSSGFSVSSNTVTAPDGGQANICLNGTSGPSNVAQAPQIGSGLASTRYTVSVYAKSVSGTGFFAIEYRDGSGSQTTARFDLINGSMTQAPTLGSPIGRIQSIGQGWYRCSVSFTSSAVLSSMPQANFYQGAYSSSQPFAPTALWGAQFEEGPEPTAYIPTETAIVSVPVSTYPAITQNSNTVRYNLNQSTQDSENSQNLYLQLTRRIGTFNRSFTLTVGYVPEITYYNAFNTKNQAYTQFRVLSQVGLTSSLIEQTNKLANYINFRNNNESSSFGFNVNAQNPVFYVGFKEKTNRFFVGVGSDNTRNITYSNVYYWNGSNFDSLVSPQFFDGTSIGSSPFMHNGVIITDYIDSFQPSNISGDPTYNSNSGLYSYPYYWYKFQLGFSTSTGSVRLSSIVPLEPAVNEIVPNLPAATKVYDFIGTSELPSDITFSRASLATYFEYDGTLTYAPHNLLLQSQNFDVSPWTLVNDSALVLSTDVPAPDGSFTAFKLYETSTASTTRRVRQDFTRVLSQYYRFGAYIKAAERTSAIIAFTQGGVAVASLEINLTTGQVVPASVTANVATYGVESAGNGWYKVWLDSILSTSGGTSTVSIYIQSDSNYTGVIGRGIYIWGAFAQALPSNNIYYRSLASAYNGARLAYNPTNLTPNGLQIEEQRTNVGRPSHDFTSANWNKVAVGVNTIAALSPSSLMNATLVQCISPAATSAMWRQTTAGGLSFSASVFVKKGNSPLSANNFRLQNSTTSSNLINFSINYDTLDVFATVGTAGISVQKLPNDWIRLGLSTSQGIAATTNNMRFYIGFNSIAANTVGDFLYAWGAQMEAGAFPTSFIPTGGADVTRSADNVGINGSNLTSWFNSSEGTFFAEAFNTVLQPSTTRRFVFNAGLSNSPTNYLTYGLTTVGLNSRFFEVSAGSSRMNMLPRSEQFNVSPWLQANVGITTNQLSPFGDLRASLIIPNTTLAAHHIESTTTFTVPTGVTATFSVYAKAAGETQLVFWRSTAGQFASFDLQNGTVLSGSGAIITPVGNSWYRCSCPATDASTSITAVRFYIRQVAAYSGDDINGILLFGAQIEIGSTATEYIPTAGGRGIVTLSPSYSNALRFSEDYSHPAWVKNRIGVTSDIILAPNGTNTADFTARISTTMSAFVDQSVTFTNNVLSASIFAKAAGIGTKLGLRLQQSYPNRGDALFDLSNGTLIGALSGGANTDTQGFITSVGDGWYRCSLVTKFQTGTATSTSNFVFGPTSLNSVGVWEGNDPLLSNCYVWGAQLEMSGTVSPYIQTQNDPATNTLQTYLSATGIVTGRPYEFAGTYKLNNFSASFDGVTTSSFSGTPPTITGVGASLLFGSGFGNTSYLNGFIRRFKYWNTQLSTSFIEIYTR